MKVGILGGGQLAMMMIQSSIEDNIEFIVVDPSDNPPANKYVECIKSEFDDRRVLDKLYKNVMLLPLTSKMFHLARYNTWRVK